MTDIAPNAPTALVTGGVSPHIAVIKRLKSLGYRTVLVDYKETPLAAPHADLHLQISTLDADAVEQAARTENASAIVNVSLDQPLPIVAEVRVRLGLASPLSPEAAFRLTNKDAMKQVLRNAAVDTAKWTSAQTAEELDLTGLRFPVIAKPIGGTGSLGIILAQKPADLIAQLDHCFAQARGEGVLVEEFIEGLELSLDYIIIGGEVHFLLARERYKTWVPDGKGLTCHATLAPGLLEPETEALGQKQAEAIAAAFGIQDGPLSVQAILTADGRLCVLEVAGRIGGGPGSNRVVSLVTGFDYTGASIDQQLGRPVTFETHPDPRIFCAHNVYASEGRFDRVTGMEALHDEGLVMEEYRYKVAGETVPDQLSSRSRVTAFIACADSRDALRDRLARIYDRLDILDHEGRSILRRDIALHHTLDEG